jgi:hypothetical protein
VKLTKELFKWRRISMIAPAEAVVSHITLRNIAMSLIEGWGEVKAPAYVNPSGFRAFTINGKRELGSLFSNPCKPLGDPLQHSRSAIAEDQDHTCYEDATFIGVS